MNENLDLTKILEGCPKGTEFYSSTYGKVIFIGVRNTKHYPIELRYYSDEYESPLITYVTKDGKEWFDCNGECILFPSKDQRDWSKFERFWDKPKVEKFDVNTLQPFDKVLVRNYSTDEWKPNFFGYINNENPKTNFCFRFCWKYCIPYNEETKHLVGTTNDCSNYYKWWEE